MKVEETVDTGIKIKIALPFLFVIIGISALGLVNFKPVFNSFERQVIDFAREDIPLQKKRECMIIGSDLKSPIEFSRHQENDFPDIPLNQLVPIPGQTEATLQSESKAELKVSMIVIGNKLRKAVLNGSVVTEGDLIEKMIVKRIERDKVLLIAGDEKFFKAKSRWVYLEK